MCLFVGSDWCIIFCSATLTRQNIVNQQTQKETFPNYTGKTIFEVIKSRQNRIKCCVQRLNRCWFCYGTEHASISSERNEHKNENAIQTRNYQIRPMRFLYHSFQYTSTDNQSMVRELLACVVLIHCMMAAWMLVNLPLAQCQMK